jgi:hypothetical protein
VDSEPNPDPARPHSAWSRSQRDAYLPARCRHGPQRSRGQVR